MRWAGRWVLNWHCVPLSGFVLGEGQHRPRFLAGCDTLWCGSLGGFGFVLGVRPSHPLGRGYFYPQSSLLHEAGNLTVFKLPLEPDLVAISYYFLLFDPPFSGVFFLGFFLAKGDFLFVCQLSFCIWLVTLPLDYCLSPVSWSR